jgi:actin-related protein 5
MDRRSHASQLRMKSIANLASDTPNQKRRRRGQDGKVVFFYISLIKYTHSNYFTYSEDTFGMDDNDWSIYKEIVSIF